MLHGLAGESTEIIEMEEVGLAFEPENATELCHKLSELQKVQRAHGELWSRSLQAARKFERSALAKEIPEVREEVVSDSSVTASAEVRSTNSGDRS
jgi:hypothetical protein